MKLTLAEDGIPAFLVLTAWAGEQAVARVHLTKDHFDGPMSVQTHPVIVTAIRIAADLKTAAEGNWTAAASFLSGIDDAADFAASLGYDLTDWL